MHSTWEQLSSAEQRTEAAVHELELARQEARAAKVRMSEAERVRAQIVQRMQAARRDVYDANLRAEEANLRAEEAEGRADCAEAATALARLERDSARQERDALLSSTLWRATWPIRAIADYIPAVPRRTAAVGLKMAWWCITFKLPRKLRERHTTRELSQAEASTGVDPTSIGRHASTRPVTAARIDCRKSPKIRPETGLFVTRAPEGQLRPHVRGYLEALVREGIGVVLIVAVDRKFLGNEPWLYELVDGLFIRANEGFDFAAWAHVLRLHPQFCRAKTLYLLNDSVIGPVRADAFHVAIERVRETPGDVVGLTENFDRGWHIQSYFLSLREGALRSATWKRFLDSISSLADKDEAIDAYEVRLAAEMVTAGLRTAVVFKTEFRGDPTVYRWRELLREGFPFIKVKTIRDDIPGLDRNGWQQALTTLGFDVSIANAVLAQDAPKLVWTNESAKAEGSSIITC